MSQLDTLPPAGRIKPWHGKTTTQRFWSYINRLGADDCWMWTGPLVGAPPMYYGSMWWGGRRIHAHRISWMLHRGGIPPGLWVLHRCDVPLCVNPRHLFTGTNRDNVQDRHKKGRSAKGERVTLSKLKNRDVLEIRERYRKGEAVKTIARSHDVWDTTVYDIVRYTTWKHLP